MKKLFTLLFMSALVVGANAQTTFSDDFESYAEGDYIGVESPVWTTWSGATGTAEDAQVVTNQALSGSNSVYFSSNGANGGPQDVILPFGAQHTTGLFTFTTSLRVTPNKNAYFNFQADPIPGEVWTIDFNAENGNIALTESGALKASGTYTPGEWFEITIEANLTFNIWKLYVDGELAGTFSNGTNAVASADIFPVQGSAFWIDDISFDWEEVEIPNLNLSAVSIGSVGVLAGIIYEPVVQVRNNGLEPITSFDIELTHDGGTSSQVITDVNIAPGEYYPVGFDATVLAEGAQTLVATVSNVNGLGVDDFSDDDTYSYMINLVPAAIGKRAVVEEGTGTWCQFCPRGALTMERMSNTYGGSYVGIAVHNNDPMAVAEYDSGLNLNAFPTGKVDRGPQIGDADFESTWIQRMQIAPKAYVSLAAQYDEITRLVEVVVEAEMVESVTGNYRVGLAIVENGVTGTGAGWSQSNAFSGQDVDMGGYEDLPNPVPASLMVYDHVGRAILPSFDGAEDEFELFGDLNAGEIYALNFQYTLPEGWDESEIELVAMFYASNNRIDNAFGIDLDDAIDAEGWYDSGNFVGLNQLPEPDAVINLYPNPANGMSFIDMEMNGADNVTVDVVSIDGRIIASRDYGVLSGLNRLPVNAANFSSGIYLIQVKVGNTQKVMKLLVQ